MRISDAQLKKIFPRLSPAKREEYLPLLVAAMEEFAIVTRKRACAFLAQIGHESTDLKYLQELASGADLGNTPERDGDGRKYTKAAVRFQITGKQTHLAAGTALGLDLIAHPELLALPQQSFRATAWLWQSLRLNEVADRLTLKANASARDLRTFDVITKTISGGYNGRLDRQRRYQYCIAALGDKDFEVPNGPLPGDETIVPGNETKPAQSETNSPQSETNSANRELKFEINGGVSMSKLMQKLLGVNWKTTAAAITAIAAVVGNIVVAWKAKNFNAIFSNTQLLLTDLGLLLAAIGLLNAKDNNVTGAGSTGPDKAKKVE